ncbi:CAP domain-containing protein [Cellulomonas sp. Leaf334]|uniref:CAP domain-containing protein n=1 Tax=Cellulomonas sp. Leaf334 TaxID=1736339 RepID=UPI0006F943A7|nr:CAP domain-containing protein [Cellulomonas sp. Leaf334]KQR12071.1 hypothetical protein ASF78_12925 [Cellulomonas sp. Leaf334]
MSRKAGGVLVAVGLVLAAVAVFLVLRPSPTTTEPWSADGADPVAYAAELVVGTNAARADEDLPALTVSQCATTEATVRAEGLTGGEELEHASLTPVIEACAPASTAAENLARAAASPHDVVDAWLDSPGHRANLLDPDLEQVGIGCLLDGDEMLCSQVFLGP